MAKNGMRREDTVIAPMAFGKDADEAPAAPASPRRGNAPGQAQAPVGGQPQGPPPPPRPRKRPAWIESSSKIITKTSRLPDDLPPVAPQAQPQSPQGYPPQPQPQQGYPAQPQPPQGYPPQPPQGYPPQPQGAPPQARYPAQPQPQQGYPAQPQPQPQPQQGYPPSYGPTAGPPRPGPGPGPGRAPAGPAAPAMPPGGGAPGGHVVGYPPNANAPALQEPPAADGTDPSVATAGKGEIIVVFSCRGGAGSTTLTVNVGASLARAGKSVCVVDLDLQLGDVFVALDLEPNTSLAALAREASTIDAAALKRRLQHHDSGLWALGQTGRIDEIDPTLSDRMPALLATLAEHFDVVILDGVRDFNDNALAALDMADRIAMVVTQDVPSIRRAERVMELFRRLGYSDRKLALVVNRYVEKATVTPDEIERALQMRAAAIVRNDWKRMRAALDEGALLEDVARGSGIALDVGQVARVLLKAPPGQVTTHTDKVPGPRSRPGLLGKLFRSKKGRR